MSGGRLLQGSPTQPPPASAKLGFGVDVGKKTGKREFRVRSRKAGFWLVKLVICSNWSWVRGRKMVRIEVRIRVKVGVGVRAMMLNFFNQDTNTS